MKTPATGTDLRLTLALNRLSLHPPLLRLLRIASRLGDGVFWYVLMAVIAVTVDDGTRIALHMGLTAVVVAGLYRSMKGVIRRPRPFRSHRDVVVRIRPLDEFSFPSGHTLHAVTFTLIALHYLPGLAWLLVPFTALVALSRVALGVHYPSDVLAAAAIAFGIAWTSLSLFG